MRLPRQKPEGPCVFHCRSHLVPEVPYLIPLDKHSFTRRFRRLAAFHDMTLLTHSVMSNHFHLLVRSPKKVRLTHAQLLKKLRRFYGPRSREVLEFEHALRGHPQLLATLRARYLARIGDLSVFMKELKEGFSRWYNRRHDRQGTLWTQRFASTVVEVTPQMVLPAAAYIDLNAVRAGMVGDPKVFFDNAEVYALGESEQMMGRVLKKKNWDRTSYTLSSKAYFGWRGKQNKPTRPASAANTW